MSDIIPFLKAHKLFAGLSDSQIATLASLAQVSSHEKEAVLVQEGEPANDLYIIMMGEVEVLKQEEKSQYFYRITALPIGAVIGEMSLIENIPRGATIRTTAPTAIISFPIAKLRELAANPSAEMQLIYYKLVEKISHELCHRLRSANDMMVASLHSDKQDTDMAHSSFFNKMWSF